MRRSDGQTVCFHGHGFIPLRAAAIATVREHQDLLDYLVEFIVVDKTGNISQVAQLGSEALLHDHSVLGAIVVFVEDHSGIGCVELPPILRGRANDQRR